METSDTDSSVTVWVGSDVLSPDSLIVVFRCFTELGRYRVGVQINNYYLMFGYRFTVFSGIFIESSLYNYPTGHTLRLPSGYISQVIFYQKCNNRISVSLVHYTGISESFNILFFVMLNLGSQTGGLY